MTTIQNTATVKGGHCSFGSVWAAHVEKGGFRSIDFVWGVERGDVFKDPTPASTGDEVRITVSDTDKEPRSWWFRSPIRRISHYSAIVRGGWPTRYRQFGYYWMPDYWYVTFEPELGFPNGAEDGTSKLTFDAQLGTLKMPFKIGQRVWITVDLMKEKSPAYQGHPLENYTYST